MITTDELLKIIEDNGIENIIFLLPMRPLRSILGVFQYTTSDDLMMIVPAKITEERYKLTDRYKISMKSIYNSPNSGITEKIETNNFGTEHFYLSDLTSLLDQGYVRMFIQQFVE